MTTVGEVNVIVRPDTSHFRRDLALQVQRATPGATGVPLPIQPTITPTAKRKFFGEVGALRGGLLGVGEGVGARALGISALAGGLFLFGQAALGAVKAAGTLKQELNVFQQVSGATADQMARVAEEARRLGQDVSLPGVAAGDAAATMTELAKAGLSVDEVLAGTRGTLQLATAANLDFASSAQLAASALNEFELPGTEAVRIADLLAGAANAAQGDIADFGLALSQAGAVAHQAGLSVQETVVFLTELAKAGIQGSDAGTSLRVALLRLIAPTQEARDIFRELGIQITDSAGNVRVDVFEQLRQAMQRLSPATRNAALATIFGTDAIRSAAIFTREGAAGFEEMAKQVTRAGQAQEAADARTKGLLGQISGLQSNLETLGTTLGTIAIPLVGEIVEEFNKGVIAATRFTDAIVKMGEKIGGIDLGPLGTISDVLGKFVEVEGVIPGVKAVERTLDIVSAAAEKIQGTTKQTFEKTGEDVAIRGAAARAGETVGKTFVKAVEKTISDEDQGVINAARRTVREAQLALRAVVEEGRRAVEQSAFDAKQNLASIGSTLVQQVTDILDSGPLAQRIDALRASLKKSQDALQRETLRRTLRDAQKELADAERALAGGAPKTAAQKAGEKEFLTPFREKVDDAKAALEEFNSQGTIDKLVARLDAQKARIQRVFDDIIARFNAGLISAPQVIARVGALIEKNVGPMTTAGDRQGFAFRQAFVAQVEALQAQVAAIVGGPQTRRTGAEVPVISPAEAARTARGNVAAAQTNVRDAIVALRKAQTDAISGPEGTNEILKDIRRELRGPSAKKSGDVTTPKAPKGTRSGGR